MDTTELIAITSEDELSDLVGEPIRRVAEKVRPRLHEFDRRFLAESPFCLIATSDADGRCDVSPKGDPRGFTLVLDDNTIVVPDRPGNRRVDGFRNVLANPHVGLLFLIPGRNDTLRVNGRATLVRDAPFFDQLVVKGHRPKLALVVDVEEVFYHCAKAFMRSGMWKPETWEPSTVPPPAVLAKVLMRAEESLEELERYYSPEEYGKKLYA